MLQDIQEAVVLVSFPVLYLRDALPLFESLAEALPADQIYNHLDEQYQQLLLMAPSVEQGQAEQQVVEQPLVLQQVPVVVALVRQVALFVLCQAGHLQYA